MKNVIIRGIIIYYVYILKSERHGQIYTGYTKNLQQRMTDHNAGRSPHTKKFKPWKLVTYIAFDKVFTARNFEEYLKTGSGIAFSRKRLF